MSSLGTASLKKKKRKYPLRREPKASPSIAPDTLAANMTGEYSIPSKEGDYPLPSQTSQPDTAPEGGPSFATPDENIPSFEEKFKVKEEAFDEDGYMHSWAKSQFVGVPSSSPQ